MFITRKGEFSASHVCRLASITDEENRALYGENANPNGHGHNYIFEVTVQGTPDPVSGMIMDLKDLKDILEEHVIEPMDHRFLNYEVKPFDEVVPTTENIAREIWNRVDRQLSSDAVRLHRVRLYETSDLYADITAADVA